MTVEMASRKASSQTDGAILNSGEVDNELWRGK